MVSTSNALAGAVALKLYTKEEPKWVDLGIPIPSQHGERLANVPRPFIDSLKYDTPRLFLGMTGECR